VLAAVLLSLAAHPPKHRSRPTHPAAAVTVTVDVARGPVNRFRPDEALGAGVDGHSRGDADAIYTPGNVREMLSAGLLPLTYRLRTELGIEAWHWNPRGTWSDSLHHRGYWTSDSTADAPILASYGYRLPRRGNTIDQANDDGWSRLDDGDTATFWKSNPYLDPRFTSGDGTSHVQWVLVDLGARVPVDAARIAWGEPYAVRYAVQWWDGEDFPEPDEKPDGQWRTFAGGSVDRGTGGTAALRLAEAPVRARWIRILLLDGSRTAPAGSTDPRDSLGFAIRELSIGEMDGGRFVDHVRHAASHAEQTIVYASSTDPWHREEDRDDGTEQPGLDRVAASGLARGLPMLVPVSVLYDVPGNAAAELAYLRARRIPLRAIEMGEEPDGQWVRPEDFAFLYLRVVDALRRVDPAVVTGGPSLQTPYTPEMASWTEGGPELGWTGRVLRYLAAKGRARDLAFLSFEYYPWDETCDAPGPQLAATPARLDSALDNLRRDGVPSDLPWYVTEYGWSAFSGRAEVDVDGALLNADVVGASLTRGAAAAYLYGYEPTNLERAENCEQWGNNALFLADGRGQVRARTATYWGARLLTHEWAQADAPSRTHEVFAVSTGDRRLTAYAVRRPDGAWAVMLINKDPSHPRTVRLRFREIGGVREMAGGADVFRFGRAQYAWRADGPNGRVVRSLPPAHTVRGGETMVLPAYSLTVVRGRVGD
jgi:hypothetical protein